MLTKTDLTSIKKLLQPIKTGMVLHRRASKKEHIRLQQSINRLVDVYDSDQTKTNIRLERIEKTLGFASI